MWGVGVASDVDRHPGVGFDTGEQRLAEVRQGGGRAVDEHLARAVDRDCDRISLELGMTGGGEEGVTAVISPPIAEPLITTGLSFCGAGSCAETVSVAAARRKAVWKGLIGGASLLQYSCKKEQQGEIIGFAVRG